MPKRKKRENKKKIGKKDRFLELKNLGNRFFKKGSYYDALFYYKEILSSKIAPKPQIYLILSNISATYIMLMQFEDSLKYAEMSIKQMRSLPIKLYSEKPFYRLIRSLIGLDSFSEAKRIANVYVYDGYMKAILMKDIVKGLNFPKYSMKIVENIQFHFDNSGYNFLKASYIDVFCYNDRLYFYGNQWGRVCKHSNDSELFLFNGDLHCSKLHISTKGGMNGIFPNRIRFGSYYPYFKEKRLYFFNKELSNINLKTLSWEKDVGKHWSCNGKVENWDYISNSKKDDERDGYSCFESNGDFYIFGGLRRKSFYTWKKMLYYLQSNFLLVLKDIKGRGLKKNVEIKLKYEDEWKKLFFLFRDNIEPKNVILRDGKAYVFARNFLEEVFVYDIKSEEGKFIQLSRYRSSYDDDDDYLGDEDDFKWDASVQRDENLDFREEMKKLGELFSYKRKKFFHIFCEYENSLLCCYVKLTKDNDVKEVSLLRFSFEYFGWKKICATISKLYNFVEEKMLLKKRRNLKQKHFRIFSGMAVKRNWIYLFPFGENKILKILIEGKGERRLKNNLLEKRSYFFDIVILNEY